ncbi:hypothetical protein AC579_1362 [Pseudocercospora musae]|uniref:Uncharacterized protein n=1 Tax=Pseudocercospora musae TaxID=113226 RepID=A0A139IKH7_9PEZI|nr:hypothetical protein AC579_1362 [Pseudocercospora musae]
MGHLSKKKKGVTLTDGEKPDSGASIPPAPSVTELALIAERETTTTQARKAKKAETKYRVKRQATRARTERAAAKTHLKNSIQEFRSGIGASARAIWLLQYCLRERMAGKDGTKEKKQLERSETKRKKLEEKMKKAEEKIEKKKAEIPPEDPEKEAEAV